MWKRRKTCLDAVNEATFRWFTEMRLINARISGAEEDIKRMMDQLKDFTAEKCPRMLNGLVNCEVAFCIYQMNKKRTQTKINHSFKTCKNVLYLQ